MSATRIGTLVPVFPLLLGLGLCSCGVERLSEDSKATTPGASSGETKPSDTTVEQDVVDMTQPDAEPADAGPDGATDAAPDATDATSVEDSATDSSLPMKPNEITQGDVTFTARQGPVNVEIEISKPGAVYIRTCSNATKLEKQSGDGWAPLRDDSYPGSNSPGYYLDGSYRAPSMNLGCDVVGCLQVKSPLQIEAAVERVQVGTRPPPAGQTGAESPARDVQTQRYAGKVRVSLRYALDARCEQEQELQLQLDVPAGVCCPTSTSCSSLKSGGWAASEAACSNTGFADGYFTPIKDVHGCDALHLNSSSGSMCCGCPAPATGT